MKMTTYTFTLVLHNSPEFTEETAAALYSAGCDNALASTQNGVPHLEFDREAKSFSDALLSAIRDVENCKLHGKTAGLLVRRVELFDLVNAAEIARRANVSREYVRLLASGKRGPGDFPLQVSSCAGKSLWSWAAVLQWLTANNIIKADHAPIDLREVELVNAMLTTRDCEPTEKEIDRIRKTIFPIRCTKRNRRKSPAAAMRGAMAR